jgi:hypothetical protein
MTGGPTSASTGSPLGRRSFIPGTPRFVWFISLFCGRWRGGHASRQVVLQLHRSVEHPEDSNLIG